MLASSFFLLNVLIYLFQKTVIYKEKDPDLSSNITHESLHDKKSAYGSLDVSPVIKHDNCLWTDNFKGQGGLTLLFQSEPLNDFHFVYTIEDFKADFIENGHIFVWDADLDINLECEQELSEIKSYDSFKFIDYYIFKLLGTLRDSITFSYEENEKNFYDEISVIVDEEPSFFYKHYVLYLNKFKMFITSLKDCIIYVKNLFGRTKPTEVSIRKIGLEKVYEEENNYCEKYIICQINEIEKKISRLENNLKDLINHVKGTNEKTNSNAILSFLLKMVVTITILFGFKEFQIRIPVKKIFY